MATRSATMALLLGSPLLVAGCSSGGADQAEAAGGAGGWADTGVNAVSRPVAGSGVTAVTGLRSDGRLETAVYDLAGGRRLWTRPATMAGRLTGMGVQPPAVAGGLVIALEPRPSGRSRTTLTARDARTGKESWTRPVDSTFGPVRCGPYVCVSESTADRNARFVALDPAGGGRMLWQMPGIAEVEWTDERLAVVFRMARHPVLEGRELRTGRRLWTFPVEQAVGSGVDLSGGWAFGGVDGTLVGSIAPYQARKDGPASAYGFFGLRITDGTLLWARKRLLRVYPSPNPAVGLFTREVDPGGRYTAFARLDPKTGRTLTLIPGDRVPQSGWWLALPADLSALAFLPQPSGRSAGTAYDLRDADQVTTRGLRVWSFCTVDPPQLAIQGQPGFYPIAPLCAYDLSTGRRVTAAGPPPDWYTGVSEGRRVWRDDRGALHAVKDAGSTSRTIPGMYG